MGSFQIEVQNLDGVWHYEKHHGGLPFDQGPEASKETGGRPKQCKKGREHSFPSLRLINFVLHMYKELTSEQRYTISVLLQKKCSLSFIAKTIGVCVSTVSREKRRNSNVQGVCMTSVWQRWKPGVARPKRPATASYLLISAAGSLNSSAGSSGRPSRSRAGSWSRRGFRYPSSPSTTGSLLSSRTARTPIPNRFPLTTGLHLSTDRLGATGRWTRT